MAGHVYVSSCVSTSWQGVKLRCNTDRSADVVGAIVVTHHAMKSDGACCVSFYSRAWDS